MTVDSPPEDAAKARAWQQHYSQAPVVASYRVDAALQPAEAAIFAALEGELAQARLLDVGVGAGRTTAHLAPACKHYSAIDFAPSMVAACRERFGQAPWFSPNTFVQADARDLPFPDASFDIVLFSFNGLDYVSRQGRQRALAQCRRVLSGSGHFIYSSHNLNWVNGRGSLPRRGSWGDWLGDHRYLRQMRRLNAAHWGQLDERAEVDLMEPPEGLSTYYARPTEHLRQAHAAGFEQVRVYDCGGQEVTHSDTLAAQRDPWLYVVARAARA